MLQAVVPDSATRNGSTDSLEWDVPEVDRRGVRPDPAPGQSALVWLSLGAVVFFAGLNDQGWRLQPFQAFLSLLAWLPLLLLRRHPWWALAGTIAAQTVWIAEVPSSGPTQFTSLPVTVVIALYSCAARSSLRRAITAGVIAVGSELTVGLLLRGDATNTALAANVLALATGVGVLLHDRQRRIEALEERAALSEAGRQEEVRRRVGEERLRIARDLHDVLAHDIAVINAQSSVAAFLLRTDVEAAERALEGIAQHSRDALDELRATVGLLRQDSPANPEDVSTVPGGQRPTPGIADLPDLVGRYTDGGHRVRFETRGAPGRLSVQAGIAAYRIAQEALTNAAKHAPGATITVDVRWSPEGLSLSVANDVTAARLRGHRGPGTGHGLVGMRERALTAGGVLEVIDDGTTFVISARLPLASTPPRSTTEQENVR